MSSDTLEKGAHRITLEKWFWSGVEVFGLGLFFLGVYLAVAGSVLLGVGLSIFSFVPMVVGLFFGMMAEMGEAYIKVGGGGV